MTRLTANISREEMTCLCGCGFNVADYELITAVQDSADFFKHRDRADRVRVTVTSGDRCKEHNKEIGGAEHSQHVTGKAMDFIVETFNGSEYTRVTADDLASYLDGKYPEKYGIGIYFAGRVHLDVRPSKARWRS